jgi:hypothetical protein
MLRIFTTLALFLIGQPFLAQQLTYEKHEDGILVMEDGGKVLFYQASTKSHEGKFPRANYVHPLYNVDGMPITEDFPTDHLHHRGVFWAWHQVSIGGVQAGDPWECRDFEWQVQHMDVKEHAGAVKLKTEVLWKSPHWKYPDGRMKPFVEENGMVTIHLQKANYRIIDFHLSFRALEPDMRIGGSDDAKGYGGFSVRMKMPPDIRFESGDSGISPQVTAVEAANWMNISGSLTAIGQQEGLLIISHPENPGSTEKWILRKSGSMQNPVYPGRKPVPVSMTKHITLQYRLVVYSGSLSTAVVQELVQDFQ